MYLFKDLASSCLNFSIKRCIRSLHPLLFNSTGLSLVENKVPNVAAMISQSWELVGLAATSFASAISCFVSGHLKGAVFPT